MLFFREKSTVKETKKEEEKKKKPIGVYSKHSIDTDPHRRRFLSTFIPYFWVPRHRDAGRLKEREGRKGGEEGEGRVLRDACSVEHAFSNRSPSLHRHHHHHIHEQHGTFDLRGHRGIPWMRNVIPWPVPGSSPFCLSHRVPTSLYFWQRGNFGLRSGCSEPDNKRPSPVFHPTEIRPSLRPDVRSVLCVDSRLGGRGEKVDSCSLMRDDACPPKPRWRKLEKNCIDDARRGYILKCTTEKCTASRNNNSSFPSKICFIRE